MERTESPDVLDYYRRAVAGHVYIREAIEALLEAVTARIGQLDRPPRVLELGSHAGFITNLLLERAPQATIIVCDDNEDLVGIARKRSEGRAVEYISTLDALAAPVDLVLSIARHHHLPHDYLGKVHRTLKSDGVYIVADELCPEYCVGEHAHRIATSETLHIAGGYVLTSKAEVAAFEASRAVPSHVQDLERLRQRALWRWYRFVVDEAVQRGYFDIAVGELQSTHDDLITGSDAEHKFSPLIVERQFELAGFQRLSKRMIGPVDIAELQSMHVFEYGVI